MTYQSFLISNFATGLDNEVQPWLLPNDALIELLDGFVYRGVMTKRDGYAGYATGKNSFYTPSRMIHSIVALSPEAFGTGNGTAGTYSHTAANIPLKLRSITITAGGQSATDDGNGGFVTSPAGGTGTVNYATGAMTITFNAVVNMAVPITVTYSYYPGLPVMGIMNFYPDETSINQVRQLLVADTRFVNIYDPTTDQLVDVPAGTYTGSKSDFWSWVNYAAPDFTARLLFSNGVVSVTDVIQQYTNAGIVNYPATFDGAPFAINARQMFIVRDRLVLFQTIESGTLFPRRIRISGTGLKGDDFGLSSPGAGFIDIPDNTWFFGAAFNRDDVLFFTQAATWTLKYTGNDVKPFILQKIDGSRGSFAAFSVISYLNRTLAASPRGLIMSDGYSVDRIDNNIPDFTFNSIDNNNFNECFSGFVDEDRDVYLIYPSQGVIKPLLVPDGSSDRILVINFEEDNYAVYRIPLSCMGNFQESITVTWAELTADKGFPNWDSLEAVYEDWNAFPFSAGTPLSIGGGHKGEIWALNNDQSEDNPQMIRSMTVIDSQTLRVTTDWNNYNIGDYISFESVGGMTQVNNKQAAIIATPTPFNTFDVQIQTLDFSAYTSGGIASKTIPFEATGKKLNPWIESDKKVKCGWLYFYVSTADTDLTDPDGVPIPAFLFVDILTNNNEGTDFSNPTFRYQIDCSPINNEKVGKKWVKIWINQVGQFLQFKISNNQAGARTQVHAIMLGFEPVGRLI